MPTTTAPLPTTFPVVFSQGVLSIYWVAFQSALLALVADLLACIVFEKLELANAVTGFEFRTEERTPLINYEAFVGGFGVISDVAPAPLL